MTAYPRLDGGREWEQFTTPREWLYQTPEDILIKASNGASDFGNKFGQPLICGSVQTFEHFENGKKFGFDKVIMQAGGVGYGRKQDSIKDEPQPGDKVVLLGGDNYRIGMAAVPFRRWPRRVCRCDRTECRAAFEPRNAETSLQCDPGRFGGD